MEVEGEIELHLPISPELAMSAESYLCAASSIL